MLISAMVQRRNNRPQHLRQSMRGITLIEMLVVMGILSAVAFVAAATVPNLQSDAEQAARQFALSLQLAEDAGALSGRQMRLTERNGGYVFEVRRVADWAPAKAGRISLSNRPPAGVIFSMQVDNPVLANARALGDGLVSDNEGINKEDPSTVIDPAGLPSEIRALFIQGDEQWRVLRTKAGEVDVAKVQ